LNKKGSVTSGTWNTKQKKQLLSKFSKLYPDPSSELNFKDDYQLIVAVILSAQCTDKKGNEVTPQLFKLCSNFKKLAQAKVGDIEKIIRPVNYYKTKSKNIISMAKSVYENFGGKLPESHQELTSLAGVGRKTANVVQSELGIVPALPVDTHVLRVSNRLGLVNAKTPEKVEDQLKQQFKPDKWRNLHHWLIFHGRRVCKAQNPACAECAFENFCPSSILK